VAEAGEQTYADALSKFFGAQVNGLTLMPVDNPILTRKSSDTVGQGGTRSIRSS
jgi:hypothetical protein